MSPHTRSTRWRRAFPHRAVLSPVVAQDSTAAGERIFPRSADQRLRPHRA